MTHLVSKLLTMLLLPVASSSRQVGTGPHPPFIPAAYDNVIAVGAAGPDGSVVAYSNKVLVWTSWTWRFRLNDRYRGSLGRSTGFTIIDQLPEPLWLLLMWPAWLL